MSLLDLLGLLRPLGFPGRATLAGRRPPRAPILPQLLQPNLHRNSPRLDSVLDLDHLPQQASDLVVQPARPLGNARPVQALQQLANQVPRFLRGQGLRSLQRRRQQAHDSPAFAPDRGVHLAQALANQPRGLLKRVEEERRRHAKARLAGALRKARKKRWGNLGRRKKYLHFGVQDFPLLAALGGSDPQVIQVGGVALGGLAINLLLGRQTRLREIRHHFGPVLGSHHVLAFRFRLGRYFHRST